VARLLGSEREAVESRCRELAEREQFLQYIGTRKRPSGTSSALYGFTHALYQNVIYNRIGEAKRRRLHQSIGDLLEKVFQEATDQVAAELALHFERAGDYQRAVRYLIQAAQKASQQSAYQEAIDHAATGLALLKSIAQSPSKFELELNLELLRGVALASTQGYSTDEAKNAFAKARALLGDVGNEPLLFHALAGLWSFYLIP
jgi:predicted ATPase